MNGNSLLLLGNSNSLQSNEEVLSRDRKKP